MGAKCWGSCTEADSRRSLSAWQWLQVGRPAAIADATARGQAHPKLRDALLTRLIGENMVLQNVDGRVWVGLGNASWAALLYPLEVQRVRQDGLRDFCWCGIGAVLEFAHVLDPRQWKVVACKSYCVVGQGIILQETEPPLPLLEASLRSGSREMSQDLLQQVADFLNLDMGGRRLENRAALLRAVANGVFHDRVDREEIVANILSGETVRTKAASAQLLQDPIFEATWDEMPADEQFEFPDVKKEKGQEPSCSTSGTASCH